VFFHVTLRGALPAVGVAALWVAIVTAGEMTVTDLFLVRTYAEELYTRFAVGPQLEDAPLGVLPGVMLVTGLVAAALVLCARLAPRDRPISLRRRWVFRLGRGRLPLTILTALLLLLLAGVPLVNLCYKAGALVTLADDGPLRTWSLGKCLAIVGASPMRYRREFGWSLSIGASAATAAVVLAIGLAWLARRGRLRAIPTLLIMAVCLALPGPVIGLGIIRLLSRPDVPTLTYLYDQSILAPWMAMLVRSLPLATLLMWHALRTVPDEMLDSAAVDGAGPLGRLCWIALPCRLPALGLAWVVALAVALGDLAASILVVPPGMTTLSIQIFDLLHSSVEDQVAGISLALIMVFAVVTGLAAWLAGRWEANVAGSTIDGNPPQEAGAMYNRE
jgi:iron(III) transport system permease protein